jgi:CDP-glucose 4,6-dehydratase
MSILITGASGFVGAALARQLHCEGLPIVSMVRDRTIEPLGGACVYGDVRDGDFVRRVLADYEVGTVYHLAAQAIVSACAEDPPSALDVAVMGTARLLQAARDCGRPVRVVVSTSDKVYGAAPAPYDEETPLDARHSYEVSKACQDLVARMFSSNYGLDVRVVRAVNIYGPGDPNESRLIPRNVKRILSGQPPLLHAGAAEMRRQYVYIDDLVAALRIVEARGRAGQAYCVGSPDPPLSVLEVMRALCDAAQVPFAEPEVRAREARFCEIPAQAVRDHKLRALGWVPRVPFAVGLRRTLTAYAMQLHGQQGAEP